ncbi:MAG: hypothetical protein IJ503_00350 [Akkermansia sp.]|nr:hypothetical protein [Akkermansia sp.]
MRKWVKICVLLPVALMVWVAGEFLLLTLTPVAYVVERSPLPLSQVDMTAQEVEELNHCLQDDGGKIWNISPGVGFYGKNVMQVVPTADGGLELLQVRLLWSWCWGSDGVSIRRQQALESWLNDRKGRAE